MIFFNQIFNWSQWPSEISRKWDVDLVAPNMLSAADICAHSDSLFGKIPHERTWKISIPNNKFEHKKRVGINFHAAPFTYH